MPSPLGLRAAVVRRLFVLPLTLTLLGFISPPLPVAAQEADKSAAATWAHIELKGSYAEGPQMMGLFGEASESLSEALGRLDKAAKDDGVTGVVLKIDGPQIGRGKLNEFRQAISRVRAKGKKVVAYLDSAAGGDYLVAAGCDEVVMPESGVLMLLGVRSEVSFYKNLFDFLGVKAEMLRVGEYKSAAEPYSRTEMSKEFREELEQVLGDFYDQMVEQVATGRGLTTEKVKAAIDNGPHTANAAKELGLITRVAYEDELTGILKGDKADTTIKLAKRYGKKKIDTDFSGFTGMMKMMEMLMGLEPKARASKNPKIAVIHASGMIMPGASSSDFLGDSTLGSDTLVKAIEKASSDATVKAIVLRVDSPGGSALASDLIWRALEKVEKPIVASMGDVAGSGGYYIAMGADTIFAEPGTITGSIGVVGGKIAARWAVQQDWHHDQCGGSWQEQRHQQHDDRLHRQRTCGDDQAVARHLQAVHREGREGSQDGVRETRKARARPYLFGSHRAQARTDRQDRHAGRRRRARQTTCKARPGRQG